MRNIRRIGIYFSLAMIARRNIFFGSYLNTNLNKRGSFTLGTVPFFRFLIVNIVFLQFYTKPGKSPGQESGDD